MRFKTVLFKGLGLEALAAGATAVALTTTFAVAAITQPAIPAAGRLTDGEVKQLFERIDDQRGRFADQLDSTLKRSILRGPGEEVDVAHYLDDLKANIGKLKDRFKPDYAASAEATTVLRQATDIERYMATLRPNYKGASEWNELAASLGVLAAAYGTTFPMPERETARRIGDGEVRDAADQAAKSIDRFKKELDLTFKKNPAVDKAARQAAINDVDLLKREARTLASRISDAKPATGEAQQLLDHARRIWVSDGRSFSPGAQAAWSSVSASLEKIAQAFAMPGPNPLSRRQASSSARDWRRSAS